MNARVLACTALALVACKQAAEIDFTDLAGQVPTARTFKNKLELGGAIGYGEQVAIAYTNRPLYRGVPFTALPGDAVEVRVSSEGDPRAWILDEKFRILASNDNADGGRNARVRYTVPAGTGHRKLLVVARDRRAASTLTIALSGPPPLERYRSVRTAAAAAATGRGARAAGPYTRGTTPAGAWMSCFTLAQDFCGIRLDAVRDTTPQPPAPCVPTETDDIITTCSTFDPRARGDCRPRDRIGCSEHGCTFFPACYEDDRPGKPGCQARPSRCFKQFRPPHIERVSLCKCKRNDFYSFEGWIAADPKCCDETKECAPAAAPPPAADCPPPSPEPEATVTARVVGKSYIGPIEIDDPADLALPLLANIIAPSAQDPAGDSAGAGYQLRSAMTPSLTCKDGKRTAQRVGVPAFDALGDLVLGDAGAVVVRTTETCATFEARVRARLTDAAARSLELVLELQVLPFEHTATATLCCDGATTVDIQGSRFPSHRIYTDGRAVKSVRQGPLDAGVERKLPYCDATHELPSGCTDRDRAHLCKSSECNGFTWREDCLECMTRDSVTPASCTEAAHRCTWRPAPSPYTLRDCRCARLPSKENECHQRCLSQQPVFEDRPGKACQASYLGCIELRNMTCRAQRENCKSARMSTCEKDFDACMKVDQCDPQRRECSACVQSWVHGACSSCARPCPGSDPDFSEYSACWKAVECYDCGGPRCQVN